MVIVTVDTTKDTPEQVMRTIAYLQELVGKSLTPATQQPAEERDLVEEFLGVEFFKEAETEQKPEQKDAAKPKPAEPKNAASILREVARRPVEKKQDMGPCARTETQSENASITTDEPETFIEIVEYD